MKQRLKLKLKKVGTRNGGNKMQGYCKDCKKNVQGVKKPISWLAVFLWCMTGIGMLGYIPYRLFCVPKNRCPVCGLKISWGKKNE